MFYLYGQILRPAHDWLPEGTRGYIDSSLPTHIRRSHLNSEPNIARPSPFSLEIGCVNSQSWRFTIRFTAVNHWHLGMVSVSIPISAGGRLPWPGTLAGTGDSPTRW